MKIKTSELLPPALDEVVAKCQGVPVYFEGRLWESRPNESQYPYEPSTEWSQGGPIIDQEKIQTSFGHGLRSDLWFAERHRNYALGRDTASQQYGPTALVAAMRCYVASKLGDEVDVPEELL